MAESLITRRGCASADVETGQYEVRFIDYDGTVLKTQWVDAGQDATPPENPSHTDKGLTFQGWLSGDDYTNIQRDSDIGAIYTTTDGKTHVHVIVDWNSYANTRQFWLGFYKSDTSTLSVDWGNGTITTNSNSGNIAMQSPDYPATNPRAYTIKIWISSGSGWYGIGKLASGMNSRFFLQTETTSDQGYNGRFLQKFYTGDNVKIFNNYTLDYSGKCSEITLSNGVEVIGHHAFRGASGISGLNMPNSIVQSGKEYNAAVNVWSDAPFSGIMHLKNIVLSKNAPLFHSSAPYENANAIQRMFQSSYFIKKIIFPATETNNSTTSTAFSNMFIDCISLEKVINAPFSRMTNINPAASCFYGCRGLREMPQGLLPNNGGWKQISASMFNEASNIRFFDIPSHITVINASAFSQCANVKYFIFRSATVPTLANANAFPTLTAPTAFSIYVPDASVAAYKAATNWSSFAYFIRPLSEIE